MQTPYAVKKTEDILEYCSFCLRRMPDEENGEYERDTTEIFLEIKMLSNKKQTENLADFQ
jgi:hypothetical protein